MTALLAATAMLALTLPELSPAVASPSAHPMVQELLAPLAPTKVTATQVPGTDRVHVAWQRPVNWGTSASDYLRVAVADVTNILDWKAVGNVALCMRGGVCDTSIDLLGLTPGHTFLAFVWAHNDVGSGLAGGVVFTVDASCDVGACVTVDATDTGAAFANKASGLLGGDVIRAANRSQLNALQVQWWRMSTAGLPGGERPPKYQAFDKARNRGAKIIEVLSGDWSQQLGGPVPNPADDWSVWDDFVRAKVSQSIADGRSPDYWEVWNEPGVGAPSVIGGPLDTDTQLALYEHTWKAIKSVDPDAKLAFTAAPSLVEATGLYRNTLGIPQFLDFVHDHGLTLGALTYHDAAPALADSVTGNVDELQDRAATARRWLDDRGMTKTRVVIDEYGGPDEFGVPAANLAYFSAIEHSVADGSTRSCWNRHWPDGPYGAMAYNTCLFGQMDGLTDLGGTHTLAAYWVQNLYANLHGHVAAVTSSSSAVPAMATVTADGATTLLVGQHSGCTGDVWHDANPSCPSSEQSAPSLATTVTVHLPHAGTWNLDGVVVPNTTGVVDAPTPLSLPATVTTDSRGAAVVHIDLADGAVTQLSFSPED